MALLLTMIHEGPRVIADPDNYEARANIMWAGMMAHNNSCGVGRSQDWNSHNIEHELSALYDCAHGAGLAVTMPAVFTYVMNHNIMRFAQAAVRVWGCQMDFAHPEVTAKEGIEKMRQFFISIGMPKNFAELGAKEEDIPALVLRRRARRQHFRLCEAGRGRLRQDLPPDDLKGRSADSRHFRFCRNTDMNAHNSEITVRVSFPKYSMGSFERFVLSGKRYRLFVPVMI